MAIGLIQIFVLIFGLFAFSRAVLRYRGGSIKLGELFFWAGVWILGMLFAIFPDILNRLSIVSGFIRGMDFVVTLSVIILFYLMFRLYVKLDELDQTITRMVREIAITKAKK